MSSTDTCDWPKCRDMAVYTYSAGTPTVGLCEKHWNKMCFDSLVAWDVLKLKPKPKLPPGTGFAEAAAVVKNHRPE